MSGYLSRIKNARVVGCCRAGKIVAFVLAALLLLARPLLASPPAAPAAGPSAFDDIAKDIEKSVTELGYPKNVGQDLARLVRDWKLEVWKQAISQARQKYQQKQISAADVALVEESVVRWLYETIKREIALPTKDHVSEYFLLPEVVKEKKAMCLGYTQLVYILGQSIGLRVTAIDVLELASGRLPSGKLHMACNVDLSDGKVVMVDVAQGFVSKPFVFADMYRAAGNYWELKQSDNPLRVHPRIQVWDTNGIVGGIYSNSGFMHRHAGDNGQAIACYTKAIELNPKYAEVYCNRGAAYVASGQSAKAISDCDRAIELNPKYGDAYCNRGVAYGELGQPTRAISDYNKAIELSPKHADAYYNRGIACEGAGQLTNALSDYNKAIELNPECTDAYYNRGLTYAKSGKLDNALHDFTKAIQLNPKFAKAYYNRGIANAKLGKAVEAKNDLQKAAELDPALKEPAKRVSDRYKLGL